MRATSNAGATRYAGAPPGMVEASCQFRLVNGHLHLPALREALEQHVATANTAAGCNSQAMSAA